MTQQSNLHRWNISSLFAGRQNLETIQHILITEDFVFQYCTLNASVNFGSKTYVCILNQQTSEPQITTM